MRFLPYGLDRLPRALTPGDPRLRSVSVGNEPLRLNTEAVPADAMPLTVGSHAARVEAAIDWLISLCGDYAPLRRQFITAYFTYLGAQLDSHKDELVVRLRPYDCLYAPEDFLWSALRPLPRGWISADGVWLPADMVFWDGEKALAVELSARATDRQTALAAAGVCVCRIEPTALTNDPRRLGASLPAPLQRFWNDRTLPSSPFRRPLPLLL